MSYIGAGAAANKEDIYVFGELRLSTYFTLSSQRLTIQRISYRKRLQTKSYSKRRQKHSPEVITDDRDPSREKFIRESLWIHNFKEELKLNQSGSEGAKRDIPAVLIKKSQKNPLILSILNQNQVMIFLIKFFGHSFKSCQLVKKVDLQSTLNLNNINLPKKGVVEILDFCLVKNWVLFFTLRDKKNPFNIYQLDLQTMKLKANESHNLRKLYENRDLTQNFKLLLPFHHNRKILTFSKQVFSVGYFGLSDKTETVLKRNSILSNYNLNAWEPLFSTLDIIEIQNLKKKLNPEKYNRDIGMLTIRETSSTGMLNDPCFFFIADEWTREEPPVFIISHIMGCGVIVEGQDKITAKHLFDFYDTTAIKKEPDEKEVQHSYQRGEKKGGWFKGGSSGKRETGGALRQSGGRHARHRSMGGYSRDREDAGNKHWYIDQLVTKCVAFSRDEDHFQGVYHLLVNRFQNKYKNQAEINLVMFWVKWSRQPVTFIPDFRQWRMGAKILRKFSPFRDPNPTSLCFYSILVYPETEYFESGQRFIKNEYLSKIEVLVYLKDRTFALHRLKRYNDDQKERRDDSEHFFKGFTIYEDVYRCEGISSLGRGRRIKNQSWRAPEGTVNQPRIEISTFNPHINQESSSESEDLDEDESEDSSSSGNDRGQETTMRQRGDQITSFNAGGRVTEVIRGSGALNRKGGKRGTGRGRGQRVRGGGRQRVHRNNHGGNFDKDGYEVVRNKRGSRGQGRGKGKRLRKDFEDNNENFKNEKERSKSRFSRSRSRKGKRSTTHVDNKLRKSDHGKGVGSQGGRKREAVSRNKKKSNRLSKSPKRDRKGNDVQRKKNQKTWSQDYEADQQYSRSRDRDSKWNVDRNKEGVKRKNSKADQKNKKSQKNRRKGSRKDSDYAPKDKNSKNQQQKNRENKNRKNDLDSRKQNKQAKNNNKNNKKGDSQSHVEQKKKNNSQKNVKQENRRKQTSQTNHQRGKRKGKNNNGQRSEKNRDQPPKKGNPPKRPVPNYQRFENDRPYYSDPDLSESDIESSSSGDGPRYRNNHRARARSSSGDEGDRVISRKRSRKGGNKLDRKKQNLRGDQKRKRERDQNDKNSKNKKKNLNKNKQKRGKSKKQQRGDSRDHQVPRKEIDKFEAKVDQKKKRTKLSKASKAFEDPAAKSSEKNFQLLDNLVNMAGKDDSGRNGNGNNNNGKNQKKKQKEIKLEKPKPEQIRRMNNNPLKNDLKKKRPRESKEDQQLDSRDFDRNYDNRKNRDNYNNKGNNRYNNHHHHHGHRRHDSYYDQGRDRHRQRQGGGYGYGDSRNHGNHHYGDRDRGYYGGHNQRYHDRDRKGDRGQRGYDYDYHNNQNTSFNRRAEGWCQEDRAHYDDRGYGHQDHHQRGPRYYREPQSGTGQGNHRDYRNDNHRGNRDHYGGGGRKGHQKRRG